MLFSTLVLSPAQKPSGFYGCLALKTWKSTPTANEFHSRPGVSSRGDGGVLSSLMS